MRKMFSVEEVIFQNKVRQENIVLKVKIKQLEQKIEYLNGIIGKKVLYKVSLLIPSGGLIYLHKMTNLPFNLCISTDKFSISHVLKSQECPFTGDLMIAFSLDAMVAGDGHRLISIWYIYYYASTVFILRIFVLCPFAICHDMCLSLLL